LASEIIPLVEGFEALVFFTAALGLRFSLVDLT
jgi:hypothetical protein